MDGRTERHLSSNPFFHLISSPSESESDAAPDVRVAVSNGDSHALIFIPARSSYLPRRKHVPEGDRQRKMRRVNELGKSGDEFVLGCVGRQVGSRNSAQRRGE